MTALTVFSTPGELAMSWNKFYSQKYFHKDSVNIKIIFSTKPSIFHPSSSLIAVTFDIEEEDGMNTIREVYNLHFLVLYDLQLPLFQNEKNSSDSFHL